MPRAWQSYTKAVGSEQQLIINCSLVSLRKCCILEGLKDREGPSQKAAL